MSRKTRKVKIYSETPETSSHFDLRKISPKTISQSSVFEAYRSGQNLFCHGFAGTGKTFVSLYLALKELLTGQSGYDKILIIRSVVPSRDMGFLPGSPKEKAKVYEEPYKMICDNLFGRGDGYDILKLKKMVEFTTTSFLRGLTFDNTIILVDEVQNMNAAELHTVMTRVGENSKIIFCGDFRQTDLARESDKKGLKHFMNVLRSLEEFSFIEFMEEDVVRGGIVKAYIIADSHYRERLHA